MIEPIERLRELAHRLEAGAPVGELGPWAGAAINQWLVDAGREQSLEECFGIEGDGRGRPGWWLQERDRALRELAETHFGGLGLQGQAHKIAAEASRYVQGRWRFDRERQALPPEAKGSRRSFLWRALKAGRGRIPTSPRHLSRILSSWAHGRE